MRASYAACVVFSWARVRGRRVSSVSVASARVEPTGMGAKSSEFSRKTPEMGRGLVRDWMEES
jgi:hypothetical protein